MMEDAGALHRAGVLLMAGTDAMGFPRIAPGASLHHELRLLIESGLSPDEAMRAATVAPAAFLVKDEEFGTVAAGQRADLLLVDGNPLQDIGYLAQPVGVMARGRWFPREQLEQMLATLASDTMIAKRQKFAAGSNGRMVPILGDHLDELSAAIRSKDRQ